jgi:hypothetical protein
MALLWMPPVHHWSRSASFPVPVHVHVVIFCIPDLEWNIYFPYSSILPYVYCSGNEIGFLIYLWLRHYTYLLEACSTLSTCTFVSRVLYSYVFYFLLNDTSQTDTSRRISPRCNDHIIQCSTVSYHMRSLKFVFDLDTKILRYCLEQFVFLSLSIFFQPTIPPKFPPLNKIRIVVK